MSAEREPEVVVRISPPANGSAVLDSRGNKAARLWRLPLARDSPKHRRGDLENADLEHAEPPNRSKLWILLACQAVALLIQVLAIFMARRDVGVAAQLATTCAVGLTYGSALWVLLAPRLTRPLRNAAVVCLGVSTALQWRLRNPTLLLQYDEQQHMRTLRDILATHELFRPNPLLPVSPRYPGLETVTALFAQIGLPVIVAVTVTIIVARFVLVMVLCDAVENLTGSIRAGGLAVAAYALNSHFVGWDSQYAYQTLALPLAVAAVAFVARARFADKALPLLVGAGGCSVAVAMTHHVTALALASFLACWTVIERGQARWRVIAAAIVSSTATLGWAAMSSGMLRDYIEPWLLDKVQTATAPKMRTPFSGARVELPGVPLWERPFQLIWAVVISLLVCVLVVIWARSVLRRLRTDTPEKSATWQPRTILVALTALIPILLALRALPGFHELNDRLSTFVFLPFSVLVADGAVRWCKAHSYSQVVRVRVPVLVIATAVFLGGFLLGTGPSFSRLGGSYLPSAGGRSMDSETQAAVHWAEDAIPDGSRVGADRVTSLLLSSEAGMWPSSVSGDGQYTLAPVYFSDQLGSFERSMISGLKIRYLYVDRRWADNYPMVGHYFATGETPHPMQISRQSLKKFDGISGVNEVYRHGPVSIYDLRELTGQSLEESRSWQTGDPRQVSLLTQIAVGILVGLLLALASRYGAWSRPVGWFRQFCSAAGLWLALAAGLGTFTVVSVALVYLNIWLTPAFFITAVVSLLLMNHEWAKSLKHRVEPSVRGLRPKELVATSLLVLLLAAAFGLATVDSNTVDVTAVRRILAEASSINPGEQSGCPAINEASSATSNPLRVNCTASPP